MIETNRRTNVIDVQVIPSGCSEPEMHRHPAELFGYAQFGYRFFPDGMPFVAQVVIEAIMEEYEDRQHGEVINIWYISDEIEGHVLYGNPRF
jgi:hypothetical protein